MPSMLIYYTCKIITGEHPQSKIQIPMIHTFKYSQFSLNEYLCISFYAMTVPCAIAYYREVFMWEGWHNWIGFIHRLDCKWEQPQWKADRSSVKDTQLELEVKLGGEFGPHDGTACMVTKRETGREI